LNLSYFENRIFSCLKIFSEEMLCRRGLADESPVTVLALLYIIVGHEKHHINVLEEKYLNK